MSSTLMLMRQLRAGRAMIRNVSARVSAQGFAMAEVPVWRYASKFPCRSTLPPYLALRGASSLSAPLTIAAFHKHANEELETLYDVYDTLGESRGINANAYPKVTRIP